MNEILTGGAADDLVEPSALEVAGSENSQPRAVSARGPLPANVARLLRELGPEPLPTEDVLPCSDGEPLETQLHWLAIAILTHSLEYHWRDRKDVFVGQDMFLYFSREHTKRYDYRGPDLFVVTDTTRRIRKSWVVWDELRIPNVIVEMLSESTQHLDRGVKRDIYQRLGVEELVHWDPLEKTLVAWRLEGPPGEAVYRAIEPDEHGRLYSEQLDLFFGRWQGVFLNFDETWLRLYTADGHVVPTFDEAAAARVERAEALADQKRARAEREAARADREAARADQEAARANREAARVAALEKELAALRARGDG